MLAGHIAEQVIEPGVDVFDQLLPRRQQPGMDQGLADLTAGMAAGKGVEQLMAERPVVAGERGQDPGAITTAQPGQHAFRVCLRQRATSRRPLSTRSRRVPQNPGGIRRRLSTGLPGLVSCLRQRAGSR
jgi:hypothetical protein